MKNRPAGNEDSIFILSNSNEALSDPECPPPVLCEFCGAPRYTKGFWLGGHIKWLPVGPEPCTCAEGIAAYKKEKLERAAEEDAARIAEHNRKMRDYIKQIIGESGMGERFLRRTFESFQITAENRSAARTAQRYANDFERLLPKRGQPDPGRNGLFIAGPKGTGKTHLAAAIANQLLNQGNPVICLTMIDLLERVKRTYAKEDVDEGSVLTIYKTIPLLIIDDMGKERPTEWAVSTIYNIINGRYEAYLPTIVTTNYDSETLVARMTPTQACDSITAEATVDRLFEMCRAITLTGQSWRMK